jgi:hypothetical protein
MGSAGMRESKYFCSVTSLLFGASTGTASPFGSITCARAALAPSMLHNIIHCAG